MILKESVSIWWPSDSVNKETPWAMILSVLLINQGKDINNIKKFVEIKDNMSLRYKQAWEPVIKEFEELSCWWEWKIVHVKKPLADCEKYLFISEDDISKWELESEEYLKNSLYSKDDIIKILNKIRNLSKMEIDKYVKYNNVLNLYTEKHKSWYEAISYMQDILGLEDGDYWMYNFGQDNERLRLRIRNDGNSWFDYTNKDYMRGFMIIDVTNVLKWKYKN